MLLLKAWLREVDENVVAKTMDPLLAEFDHKITTPSNHFNTSECSQKHLTPRAESPISAASLCRTVRTGRQFSKSTTDITAAIFSPSA
jgi:hypothetical protein